MVLVAVIGLLRGGQVWKCWLSSASSEEAMCGSGGVDWPGCGSPSTIAPGHTSGNCIGLTHFLWGSAYVLFALHTSVGKVRRPISLPYTLPLGNGLRRATTVDDLPRTHFIWESMYGMFCLHTSFGEVRIERVFGVRVGEGR